MFSTRVRLTAAFAGGLILMAIAMVIALWAARNTAVYHDIGQYTATEADLVARIVSQLDEGGQVIVGPTTATVAIPTRIRDLLRGFPDYLIVLDRFGQPVYQSPAVSQLSPQDSALFRGQLLTLPGGPDNSRAGLLDLYGTDTLNAQRGIAVERLLLVARDVKNAENGATRVVVGTPTLAATALPSEYLFVISVILPLIIAGATWTAYAVLGKEARQVARITDEVSAITDGRSLHTRLHWEESSPEFNKLVSTLNAMIARLETSFLGLRRFTADASHELKTPLMVLRADVERAMNDRTPQTEKLVALEEALQEITRMSDLVESLLTLARADEGRFDIHREPVELKPLVQEVYETALILGEAAQVSVTLPFTDDVTVLGDRPRLRQLFLNLVTNAIKYTPAGGRVDIGLGKHPDNVTFAVRDTGIGIAAADFPHIFDRFWRADRVRSRTSERGGFGLGLAISQWIAQAHGGTLTASSRLGRGSLFTVTLPLPADQIAPAEDA
jgi:two-component system, OmpR family, sensor kinase